MADPKFLQAAVHVPLTGTWSVQVSGQVPSSRRLAGGPPRHNVEAVGEGKGFVVGQAEQGMQVKFVRWGDVWKV